VAGLIESFRFNVGVARVMELVNLTRRRSTPRGRRCRPRRAEAVEAVAIMPSLPAPYTAGDARLGHEPSVALAGWPAVDPELLVAEGDQRRPGGGQGPRPAAGAAVDQQDDLRERVWPVLRCSGHWPPRRADGRGPRSEPGQRRPGLSLRSWLGELAGEADGGLLFARPG
jgi:hypothetical protein